MLRLRCTRPELFTALVATSPPFMGPNTFFQSQVIDGIDVLDAMEKVPVGKKDRPVTDILINSITMHANPIAEKG